MGALVVVLVAVAVIMPILASAEQTHATFNNEGMYYIDYNDDETHAIEYEKTADSYTLTVDGEAVELTDNAIGCTIVAGDNFILRYHASDDTLQYKGNSQYVTGIIELSGTIAAGTFNATCTTNTTVSISATSADIYSCTSEKTSLIMSNYNEPVRINSDSEIFGFGQSSVGNTMVLFKISGTIDNLTIEARDSTTGAVDSSYTITNAAVDSEAVDGYIDLYDLNKITFTATKGDDTANITFSAYIVPASVTAELSEHPDGVALTIIQILPVLILVGVLMMIVGAFIANRRA